MRTEGTIEGQLYTEALRRNGEGEDGGAGEKPLAIIFGCQGLDLRNWKGDLNFKPKGARQLESRNTLK